MSLFQYLLHKTRRVSLIALLYENENKLTT